MKILHFSIITLIVNCTCAEWTIHWQDEFNGDSIDPKNWEYSDECNGSTPSQPWGNNEKQCYSNSTDTVRVENGTLILTARPLDEPQRDHNFTSGKLIGKLGFTYGKFEMRARMPRGKHLWPAFWMLPLKMVYGKTFAASGEIDIMELRGDSPNQVESTIHYGGIKPDFNSSGGYVGDFFRSYADDYHLFGAIWDESAIKFYADETLFHIESLKRNFTVGAGPPNPYTKPGQPFDQDFQINLNLAVSGLFFPETETLTVAEAKQWSKPTYEVDYVRVYKWKE